MTSCLKFSRLLRIVAGAKEFVNHIFELSAFSWTVNCKM